MKRSVAVETEQNHSSTETENLRAHTAKRKSDPNIETSPSGVVTSEDVERHVRDVIDVLTQQLAHLCEIKKDLRDAHAHRRHEETASSRATTSSTGGRSRSDMVTGTLNPAVAPLSTLAPSARLTSPELPPLREYSVLMMKTKNRRQIPHHRWPKCYALSTACRYPPR